VASHIADGIRRALPTPVVSVVPVCDATPELVTEAELIVVGGPTHVHGLSSTMSRKSAHEMAAKNEDLHLDADAECPGLRDWFDTLRDGGGRAAIAFDTRATGPASLTGRASKGIARRLARHGFDVVADPESFLVDKHNELVAGEADRATEWGAGVAGSFIPAGRAS
jgi:hypothetical protein